MEGSQAHGRAEAVERSALLDELGHPFELAFKWVCTHARAPFCDAHEKRLRPPHREGQGPHVGYPVLGQELLATRVRTVPSQDSRRPRGSFSRAYRGQSAGQQWRGRCSWFCFTELRMWFRTNGGGGRRSRSLVEVGQAPVLARYLQRRQGVPASR